MAERADGRDASTAADYFPLARAAAIAHERLFPEQPTKDAKTLDVIALALSTLIPIYESEDGGAPRALGEAELAAGRFTRGGTRLEVPGRAPIRFLMVSRSDLNDALEKLAQDALTAARVSLTLRQSPRHPKPL
jgi:hypothetical protein